MYQNKLSRFPNRQILSVRIFWRNKNRLPGMEIGTIHHVQKKRWLGYRKGSQGTKGESLRMEAVRISIADAALAKTHSIMYRVHSQTYGWGAWVKDGAVAGTTGKSKRMEAIQIKLVKK